MTITQGIVTIIVAIIGLGGASIGSIFAYKQFMIKRMDEKEERNTQKLIDAAINKAKAELRAELNEVSIARSEEGQRRFDTHAEAFKEVNRQIEENTKQIGELAEISKSVLESMDSINKVVTISAESQRNSNYDRLLIVTNKVLKNKKMTISDKTNLQQLYKSWKALKGEDPKMDTMYNECLKIEITLDD